MILHYSVNSMIRQDRRYLGGASEENYIKEYSVTRTLKHITALYDCLIREYRKSGVIVPPPPKGLSKASNSANK